MSDMFLDWFPDAPWWMPWLAFWLMVALIAVFLACFAASPIDAWRNRHSHEEGKERVVRLARSSPSPLSASLSAATGIPARLFEPVTTEITKVKSGEKD